MLKRPIDDSGNAIRRILDETGIVSDVRAIADRFMRERGGDGITTSAPVARACLCFVAIPTYCLVRPSVVVYDQYLTDYPPGVAKDPQRCFVNQFPADWPSGMVEHSDVTPYCTVILMLTVDDDETTALQMGKDNRYGSIVMACGDAVVFRDSPHELPLAVRRQKRLTVNFFF